MRTRVLRTQVLRRLFSFPAMLASVLVVLGVFTVRSRFDDPDLWWNLKTGEVIWTTHSIPVRDLFSYATNHHAWIPQEWLAQVAIYAASFSGRKSGCHSSRALLMGIVSISLASVILRLASFFDAIVGSKWNKGQRAMAPSRA